MAGQLLSPRYVSRPAASDFACFDHIVPLIPASPIRHRRRLATTRRPFGDQSRSPDGPPQERNQR